MSETRVRFPSTVPVWILYDGDYLGAIWDLRVYRSKLAAYKEMVRQRRSYWNPKNPPTIYGPGWQKNERKETYREFIRRVGPYVEEGNLIEGGE